MRPSSPPHEPVTKSGAEATAVQTLSRLPIVLELREASGVRRVHRRFSGGLSSLVGLVRSSAFRRSGPRKRGTPNGRFMGRETERASGRSSCGYKKSPGSLRGLKRTTVLILVPATEQHQGGCAQTNQRQCARLRNENNGHNRERCRAIQITRQRGTRGN